LEEFISRERSSPFATYCERKAKIIGRLHGILIENPEGLLVNTKSVASILLRRERLKMEDTIHKEVEQTMKQNFGAFNI
jgi:hypothetical protein